MLCQFVAGAPEEEPGVRPLSARTDHQEVRSDGSNPRSNEHRAWIAIGQIPVDPCRVDPSLPGKPLHGLFELDGYSSVGGILEQAHGMDDDHIGIDLAR